MATKTKGAAKAAAPKPAKKTEAKASARGGKAKTPAARKKG